MNKIKSLVFKHPVWVLMMMLLLLVVSLIGVTGVSLSTGNSTLVKEDSQTYIDNDLYQNEFGGETIVLHLEPSNDLLGLDTIKLLNDIEEDLSHLESVFSYQSPATVIKNITFNQYIQFRQGVKEMGTGLSEMSELLETQASQLSDIDLVALETAAAEINIAFNQLETAQSQLGTSIVQLEDGLTSLTSVLVQLQTDLTNDGEVDTANELSQVNIQLSQLLTLLANLKNIPIQTSTGLDTMNTQLSGLFTNLLTEMNGIQSFVGQLSVLSTHLKTMSNTLLMIESYSDSFYPGIPQTDNTLYNIVYENDVRRTLFAGFIIDESYVMMQITLSGQVNKEDKQEIVDVIEARIKDSDYDGNYLLSGKAVLDLSIQNSMMSSMQKMLMLSVGLMVIILVVTFKVRWRTLPLVTVLIAVVMTVGMMGYLSIPITMVSMAVFPILIGLGIDYAIQFQNHYHLALEAEQDEE